MKVTFVRNSFDINSSIALNKSELPHSKHCRDKHHCCIEDIIEFHSRQLNKRDIMSPVNISRNLTDSLGEYCATRQLVDSYYDLTNEVHAQSFMEMFAYSTTDTIVYTTILPFILSVGVVGNLALLVVVSRIQWMRTITNCYLVNLAVADMTYLIVAIGEKLHNYTLTPFVYDDYPKGPVGCVLVPFVKDLSFFSSVLLVTCISGERFNAACRPLKQRRDKGAKQRARTAKLTTGAWLLALVMASLRVSAFCCSFAIYCLVWPDIDSYRDHPRFIGECLSPKEWISYTVNSIQFVIFTIAMCINAVLYGKITRAVKCTTARPNARRVLSGGTSVIEAKITRMVVATGVIFYICLAPYQLFSTLLMILQPKITDEIVSAMQVCRMLSYLNSSINPFIYNVANPRYRKAFRLAFTCKRDWKTQRFRESLSKTPSRNPNFINQSSTVIAASRRKSRLQNTELESTTKT